MAFYPYESPEEHIPCDKPSIEKLLTEIKQICEIQKGILNMRTLIVSEIERRFSVADEVGKVVEQSLK
jgi:hypothetical protein